MSWGLENRLARIIRPETGRTVMLAIDHGYFLGPTIGLECPRDARRRWRRYADTLMLTRGVLRQTASRRASSTPIVLRVSGGNERPRRRTSPTRRSSRRSRSASA